MAEAMNEREKLMAERKASLRTRMPQIPMVRVEPTNEIFRRSIRHQPSRRAFPPSGAVEWPLDDFTQRRIADGTVKVVEAEPATKPRPPASS